jgi:predicted Zn-dependent protease
MGRNVTAFLRLPSPLRLPASLAALLALLCLAALQPAVAQPRGISLIRDAEIERVLRGYIDPIVTAAGLSPSSVSLYIVNDESLNAFVAGGQNIFINTGMIMTLETPNQLKGVIAHETGHISGGHLVRGPEAYSKAQTPMFVTMLLGVAAFAAGAPDLGAALLMGSQQVAQRQILAYSRTQESAADQAGVTYMNAIKESPQGMLEVFEKFADQEILSGRKLDPYVRSHPLSRERVAALTDLNQRSPYRDVKDSEAQQLAYDLMKAKLRGFIERGDVTLRRYPLKDKSMPARYARAVAYFRGADLDRALVEIDALIKERPDYAYFWELKGQIYVESARPKDGIAPYRKAAALAPKEPLIQASLGAALVATEDSSVLDEAIKVLRGTLVDEPENAMAWYHLATAYERKGDEGRAQLATAERYFAIGAKKQAVQFAGRSLTRLKEGTVDWQRARDIISSGKDDAEEEERRERKQLPRPGLAPEERFNFKLL